jgi:polyhydroxybutyrate depolymerase
MRALLSSALVIAAVLTTTSGAVAVSQLAFGADIPSTAGSKPINGVPDVTGVGNTHGSISLSSLQANAPGTTVVASSVRIDGLSRGYLLVAPEHPQASALPLIVVIGGRSASPTQEIERDELLPVVEAGKAILVYPAGYGESWNVGIDGCCSIAALVGVNDVAFVKAVTEAVRATMPVSSDYLVGFSNGGKLAYQVLCDDPGLFAAAAIVAATPLVACPSQLALPILIAVGAKDPELPENGHTQNATVVLNAALATWRGYNSCSDESNVVGVGTAVTTTWSSCASGDPVVGVLYQGLDHEWPTAQLVGANVAGAGKIWTFLSDVAADDWTLPAG